MRDAMSDYMGLGAAMGASQISAEAVMGGIRAALHQGTEGVHIGPQGTDWLE
jgi:hypothetical protein